MKRRVSVVLAVVATLAASRLAAQSDPRLVAIADIDARAAVGDLIVEAERHGLPRDPLVTKALEGVEKGANGQRITAAVRAMAIRLGAARVALAPASSPAELLAAADALAAGVTANSVRTVREAAPDRSIAVALAVLAQLTARGVPGDRAARSVANLVGRGATQPQLLALQRRVQDDLADGIPAARALDVHERAIIAALPAPIPRPAATLSPTGKP